MNQERKMKNKQLRVEMEEREDARARNKEEGPRVRIQEQEMNNEESNGEVQQQVFKRDKSRTSNESDESGAKINNGEL